MGIWGCGNVGMWDVECCGMVRWRDGRGRWGGKEEVSGIRYQVSELDKDFRVTGAVYFKPVLTSSVGIGRMKTGKWEMGKP